MNTQDLINKIEILPEFKELIPPLSTEERKLLEDSIKEYGVREKLLVWKQGKRFILIDGHNRISIARSLNKQFGVKFIEFSSKEAVVQFIANNQMARRNINSFTRTYLLGTAYLSMKKDKTQNLLPFSQKDKNSPSENNEIEKNTAVAIGKKYSVSGTTIKNAARFTKIVDELADNHSVEIKNSLLSKEYEFTKNEVFRFGKLNVSIQEEIIRKLKKNEAKSYRDAKLKVELDLRKKSQKKLPDNSFAINKIYCGDSLEIIASFPESVKVDVWILDFPWGINLNIKAKHYTKFDDTKEPSLKLLDDMLKLVKKYSVDDCHLYIFFSMKNYTETKQIVEDNGFKIPGGGVPIVWHKNTNSVAQNYEDMYVACWEAIFFCTYKKQRNLNYSCSKNVLTFNSVPQTKKIHIAEKPIELIEHLILNSSIEGDLIIDPFLASGVTVEACINTNRNYIGIEKNKETFRIAQNRLDKL